MSTTTTREALDTKRQARRLAQRSIDRAGKRKDVARATGRSESTVASDVSERCHPGAFALLVQLLEDPETTARPMVESMLEAVDLAEIRREPTERLIERGLRLLPSQDHAASLEDTATLYGVEAHIEALQNLRDVCGELAAIEAVLWYERRVDLHEEARRRRAA